MNLQLKNEAGKTSNVIAGSIIEGGEEAHDSRRSILFYSK